MAGHDHPFYRGQQTGLQGHRGPVHWYIKKGCTGIFAVCQSSEMAFLTEQEKLDIAKAVVDAVDGRIQVVASGHTADSKSDQYKQIEDMMKIPGIGAMCWSQPLGSEQRGRGGLLPERSGDF